MILTSKIGAKTVLSSFCQVLQVAQWSLMTQADMATPGNDDGDSDCNGGHDYEQEEEGEKNERAMIVVEGDDTQNQSNGNNE